MNDVRPNHRLAECCGTCMFCVFADPLNGDSFVCILDYQVIKYKKHKRYVGIYELILPDDYEDHLAAEHEICDNYKAGEVNLFNDFSENDITKLKAALEEKGRVLRLVEE